MIWALVAGSSGAAAVSFLLELLRTRQKNTGTAAVESRSTTSSAAGGVSAYETAKAVDEYLAFHFGADQDILPYKTGPHDALHFTTRCAIMCEKHCEALADFTGERGPTSALDIGCAVGGATFSLARAFEQVIGIDYSNSFVEAAKSMQDRGARKYTAVVEGEITQTYTAEVPSDIDRSRVTFMQGDACALPTDLPQFDAVLAANLLCRLPDPAAFLKRMSSVVKAGGVLVLVSPHSWLGAWTPREKWLGGFLGKDGPVKTYDGISAVLTTDFELVAEEEAMPFLIREHARKFQWGCSHATVWKRRV